jgi:YHS domain-containing protein
MNDRLRLIKHFWFFATIVVVLFVLSKLSADDQKQKDASSKTGSPDSSKTASPQSRDDAKKALTELQYLVGEWRGAGQLKRGSSAGSWSETMSWAWHFEKDSTELRATIKDGKFYSALAIMPDKKANQFLLTATLLDGKATEKFSGAKDEKGNLTLTRVKELGPDKKPLSFPADRPTRITIRPAAENQRVAILYERSQGESFSRIAEVGSTRVGGNFAAGSGGPECIVTGGAGTISVSYKGKTYFVCCSGCKEAFNADPEGIIKEYNERLAKGNKK